MIDVFTANIEQMDDYKYHYYLSMLPGNMKSAVVKYRLKEDRYRTLAGKILVQRYLEKNTEFSLTDIKTTRYNKPYLENSNIDFNISHSGEYVVSAFSNTTRLGIDIEKRNNGIDIEDFKSFLSSDEYKLLQNSKKKLKKFYTIWTVKEALLKLLGTGLSDSAKEIVLLKGRVIFEDLQYHVSTFDLDHHTCSLVYEWCNSINIHNDQL